MSMGINQLRGRFVLLVSSGMLALICTMLLAWRCDGNKATTISTSTEKASTGILPRANLEEAVSGGCRFVLARVVARDRLLSGTRSEQQSYRVKVIRVLLGSPLAGEVPIRRYSYSEPFWMESGATYLLALRDDPGAQNRFWLAFVDGAAVQTGTEHDRVNDLMRRIESISSGKGEGKSHASQPASNPGVETGT